MAANVQTSVTTDSVHDAFRALDQQSELVDKEATLPTPFSLQMPTVVPTDGEDSRLPQRPASGSPSAPCPISNDDQQGEHTIEGGTISISSSYSHGYVLKTYQLFQLRESCEHLDES